MLYPLSYWGVLGYFTSLRRGCQPKACFRLYCGQFKYNHGIFYASRTPLVRPVLTRGC